MYRFVSDQLWNVDHVSLRRFLMSAVSLTGVF